MYQNQYNSNTSTASTTGSSYPAHQYYQYPYQSYGYQPPPPPPSGQPSQPPPPPPPNDREEQSTPNRRSVSVEPPPPGTTDDDVAQHRSPGNPRSLPQSDSGGYAQMEESSTPPETDTTPYSGAPHVTQSDSTTASNSTAWGTANAWSGSQWNQPGSWNQQGHYGNSQGWHSHWQQQNWSQSPGQQNWSQSPGQYNWSQQNWQQQQQPASQQERTSDKQTSSASQSQQNWQSTTTQSSQQTPWSSQQNWQQQQTPQGWQQTGSNQVWTPQQGWSQHQWSGGQWAGWGQWTPQNWPSQPPGAEAWAGQQQGYQNSGSNTNYGYQQQTDYSKQGTTQYLDPDQQRSSNTQPDLKRSRSPGTPPLNDLLPSGGPANDDPNDRGVPPVGGEKRKQYPSDYQGAPDVKRPHFNNKVGTGGGGGRASRWDSPGKKPRKTLLATPTYNAVPPPGQSDRQAPPPRPSPPRSMRPPPQQPRPPMENTTPSSRTPEKWPPRFREYVHRAFQACNNDEERNHVHQYLDVELNQIFKDGRQWDIDWDVYPSPLELRKRKAASRWDTPSPSSELRIASPQQQQPHDMNSDDDLQDVMTPTVGSAGRGRGKKRRRQKKKGKNKFFIDNQPAPGFVVTPEDRQKMTQRSNRFGRDVGNKIKKLSVDELLKATLSIDDDGLTWQDKTLEGTSEALEKQYLRLTSAPDRNTVRPVRVLKLSLKHVMDKWESERDYHYTCEQLKSIRQDLTIQTIRDEFTVLVYETHARVALRNGDRGEFNQCQAQLKSLYMEGVPGNQAEFMAYRILYLMLTHNTADMCAVLRDLKPEQKRIACIKHALSVFSAWSLGNYHRFFKLYKIAPNLSGAVIDMFLERERKAALKTIAKAFRPNIKVSVVSEELAFSNTEDCLVFLKSVEAVLDPSDTLLDCKLTFSKL